MKKTTFLFPILLFLLCCCSFKDSVELQNGYKIWFMSASKVYIGNMDNILVVGPSVEGLYTEREFIAGIVNDYSKKYFVIDTKQNVVFKELDNLEWQEKLKFLRLNHEPVLVPPTTLYNVIIKLHRLCGKI